MVGAFDGIGLADGAFVRVGTLDGVSDGTLGGTGETVGPCVDPGEAVGADGAPLGADDGNEDGVVVLSLGTEEGVLVGTSERSATGVGAKVVVGPADGAEEAVSVGATLFDGPADGTEEAASVGATLFDGPADGTEEAASVGAGLTDGEGEKVNAGKSCISRWVPVDESSAAASKFDSSEDTECRDLVAVSPAVFPRRDPS